MSKPVAFDPSQPWTGSVPISSVVPNPEQPRKHFDEAKLAATARSCGVRQVQPIGVIMHSDPEQPEVRWMIVDGERRWRGLKAIGAKTIKVTYDPEINRDNLFESSLAANFCREGHTKAEVCQAVGRLRDSGMTLEEIAQKLGRTTTWVFDYCAIRMLHPELLTAMDFPPEGERKLPMNIAKMLVSLKPFEQLGQWEKVKHLPVTEAFHKLRCSGKVRHGAERSPVEDAEYVQSQASIALKKIEALVNIPLPMMKRLSPDNLQAVIKQLDKISNTLNKALDRFTAASEEAE